MSQIIQDYIDALKTADAQLEKLIANGENSKAHVFLDDTYIFDKDFKYLYASISGAKKLGQDPAKMVGKRYRDISNDGAFAQIIEEHLNKVFVTGKTIRYETRQIPTVLGNRYFEYILNPLWLPNKEIGAVICSVRDITERKLTEKNFSKQVGKFNQIINLCPMPVVMIDKHGQIVSVNQVYAKSVCISQNDLVGKPFKYVAADLGIEYEKSAVVKALEGIETWQEYLTFSGRIWLRNALPIKDQQTGDILGAIGIYSDITEYEKLKEEMAKLDRLNLIGEMAAGVAHEIRNPMTVVKGYLQFLSKKVSESMQEQFSIALDELEHIEQIITDFLSLAGNKLNQYKEQNLNTIVKGIIPLLQTDAIKRGIDLEVSLIDDIPDLLLNEKEIKQLILNLVRNGMEAMGQHGVLIIETNVKDDLVSLHISDSGCGLRTEYREKIFDPFFTTKENGTGLGLAVCAGIVRRHNGKIEVQSEEGRGTSFIITFKPL